jgi:steroid delta-isomerase-like uncharacterized protein
MSDPSRELARRWFEEVWNLRRDETVRELLADGAVAHMEGGEAVGAESFLQARAALLGAFPDIRVTVEDVVSDDDRAVVRWSAGGRHSGGQLGIAASGRDVRFRGMTWMRFENGKIVEGWDAWNLGALLEACRSAGECPVTEVSIQPFCDLHAAGLWRCSTLATFRAAPLVTELLGQDAGTALPSGDDVHDADHAVVLFAVAADVRAVERVVARDHRRDRLDLQGAALGQEASVQ